MWSAFRFSLFFLMCTSLYIVYSWYIEDSSDHALAKPRWLFSADAPALSASHWALSDIETGEVLAGRAVDEPTSIASVVKLVTALVAYRDMDGGAAVTLHDEVIRTEGRAGRLSAGETLSVRDLLFPLLLESSNDAAAALAYAYEEGDANAFLERMHVHAREVGMSRAVFSDSSGLSSHNQSSPRELSLLLSNLFKKDRHILDITTLPRYSSHAHDWLNNNPVAGVAGYQGGKHGYTPEAGHTFAGVFSVSLADGAVRDVGIVLLDTAHIRDDIEMVTSYVRRHATYAKYTDEEAIVPDR